jgi:alpha-ribazole phosphatase
MGRVTTSFWWVRHAPVAHGARIYGQTDLSCDCSETALFTGLAEKLPHSAMWVTSNLRRTHETAAAIVRAGLLGPQPIPGPEAIMMPELAEQNFGEWQSLTYEELQESRAGDSTASGTRPPTRPHPAARASSPSSSGYRRRSTG